MSKKENNSLEKFLKEIETYPCLTEEEEKKLCEKAKKGDKEATEKLINSNIRLVVSIAKKYDMMRRGGDFEEFIQEGMLGLLKSVDEFKLEEGIDFSVYATQCIRQKICRAIVDKESPIRIPVHIREQLKCYRNVVRQFSQQTGRSPSTEEIAALMNINVEEVDQLEKILFRMKG